MQRLNKSIAGLLGLTFLGLILRKMMIPGASAILIVSLSSLALLFLIRSILPYIQRKTSILLSFSDFSFSISSIAFLFRTQNWSGIDLFLLPAFVLLLLAFVLLVHYFMFQHTKPATEKKIFRELLLPFLFYVPIITFSLFANQREFHNFFRGTTYESFIRRTYSEDEAEQLLRKNQCNDPECMTQADEYYREGLKNDSLENWEKAFECYNRAIDYNIYFTDAYCRRATNRMLHTEVDHEITESALRDCNIAISLDSLYAPAYLRRGFTNLFVKRTDKACSDFKKAKGLDATLKIDQYIKSTCR